MTRWSLGKTLWFEAEFTIEFCTKPDGPDMMTSHPGVVSMLGAALPVLLEVR